MQPLALELSIFRSHWNSAVQFPAARVLLACLAVCVPFVGNAQAQNAPLKRVQVLGNRTPVEIEIEGSERLEPKTQLLTGPDRLVVDIPNALPGALRRSQSLNLADVKSVRVGLYSANPPVTRIVLDLVRPEVFQVFPSGRTVIIKLGSDSVKAAATTPAASGVKLVNTRYSGTAVQITPPPAAPPVAAPQPPLTVAFKNGQLTVSSNKASLSEVLFEIHKRTGAEIAIPAGAEQEKVVAELGPASAPEVLSNLLNGSKFNFLIVSATGDPSALEKVILTARPEGPAPAYRPLPQASAQAEAEENNSNSEETPRNAPPPSAHPVPGADHQAPLGPTGGETGEGKPDNVPD